MSPLHEEARQPEATLVSFLGRNSSKFCGRTCCSECARKKRSLPAGAPEKRFRACELCCSKFYIHRLRTQFLREHEAKEVTIRQFDDSLDEQTRKEEKMKQLIAEEKQRIENKEKEAEQKRQDLRVPVDKSKKRHEELLAGNAELTAKEQVVSDQYKQMVDERDEVMAKISQLYVRCLYWAIGRRMTRRPRKGLSR